MAVALLLVSALPVLADSLDDAGSGSDAPDTIEEAYSLAAPGSYHGNLTPNGDADWYKLAAVDTDVVDVPACLEGRANGNEALADVNLTFDEAMTQLAIEELNPDKNPALGLTTPAFEKVYLGLVPLSGNQSTGEYNFSLSVLDLDDLDGDGGTGLDAPSLDSSEDLLDIPGPCFGGSLDENDTADAFEFDGDDEQRVLLTLVNATGEAINATLHAPSGTVYGPYAPTGNETVYEIPLDEDGTWALQLEGSVDVSTSYMTGFTLAIDPSEEEEERECEPYCFLLE